jgi:hypothetical protein
MGQGSALCVCLFQWLSSIVEIAIRQQVSSLDRFENSRLTQLRVQEFLSFLGSSFPDWLPKFAEFQRQIRVCQFKNALEGRCVQMLKERRDEIVNARAKEKEVAGRSNPRATNSSSAPAGTPQAGGTGIRDIDKLDIVPFVLKEIGVLRRDITTTKEELLEIIKQRNMLKEDQYSRFVCACSELSNTVWLPRG